MRYLFLGLVQGLTEFLPVSSSGHLVIFQTLLRMHENIAFDAVLHLATVLAVIIYFWKDILRLFADEQRLLWFLIIGTFFTGILGIAFRDFFEGLFSSIQAVGGFLVLTGIVILLAERVAKGKRRGEEMGIWDAVLIGLAQGCAIAPGLSRSGTTISVALARGFDRRFAARFSFLLSIPAVLGAGLLQSKAIFKVGTLGVGLGPLCLGFSAAFLSSLLAIKILMELIQRTSLRVFAYYCFVVGALVIILSLCNL